MSYQGQTVSSDLKRLCNKYNLHIPTNHYITHNSNIHSYTSYTNVATIVIAILHG